MDGVRVPETNSFGLVLPPSAQDLEYLRLFKPHNRHKPDFVERHHLYWPRLYYRSSELASKFRDHRFNSIWINMQDHDNLHKEYDGVPFPKEEIMYAFLNEAEILDRLGIQVKSVEMIDTAIYEGVVKDHQKIIEYRESQLENLYNTFNRALRISIVSKSLSELVIAEATEIIDMATAGELVIAR